MKYASQKSKKSKYNFLRLFESHFLFLSLKSFFKLTRRKNKEHYPLSYPLLVVSGLQRSGTHLLDNLLRNHHQILSYYKELQVGRPNKYFWPDLGKDKNLKSRFQSLVPRNMAKHFFDTNTHHNFIFDFRSFKKLFFELESKNSEFLQRQTLNNFFTAYFNAYLNCNHSNFFDAYKFISVTIPGLTVSKQSISNFLKDYPDGKLFALIRDPLLWWNSALKHTERLKKHGLDRYEKSLEATKWACGEHRNNVYAVSFDQLVHNTEKSMCKILNHAGLEFDKIATYPSNFPYYAIDNSTFGHKKTKSVLKDKLQRDLKIPEADQKLIQERIYPLYKDVLEQHAVNWIL
jgi:hypothetical protein